MIQSALCRLHSLREDFLADGNIVGGVDAPGVIGIVRWECLDGHAPSRHEFGDFGKVVFVLDVVGLELRKKFEEGLAVENKDARLQFGDFSLFGRAVLPLDDALEAPVLVPDNPCPHLKSGVDSGEKRAIGVFCLMELTHCLHAFIPEQGHVAKGDKHGPVIVLKGVGALHDGVSRSKLLPLFNIMVLVAKVADDLLFLVADHDVGVIGSDKVGLLQDDFKKGTPAQVKHRLRRCVRGLA